MAFSASKYMHALAIPMPAQGHINPLMRFCKRLASKHGFTITFVDLVEPFREGAAERESTHASTKALSKGEEARPHAYTAVINQTELTSVDANSSAAGAQERLDIRRVRITLEMPTKIEEGQTMFEAFFEVLQSSSPDIEALVSRLMQQEPPITCLISDVYMTKPTQKVADKFNIPRIAFEVSNQSVLLYENYLLEGTISLEQVLKVLATKEVSKDDIFVEGLPGLPTLQNGDLMDYQDDSLFVYTKNTQSLKEVKERAHSIAVNSSKELEDFGSKGNIGGVPIYLVGPLVEPLDKETSTSFRKEDKDCILWLNEQPSCSVIFISFGSMATLSKSQMEELVAGLISMNQQFLWVLRPDLVEDASNPSYLSDLSHQYHDKGHFVEWAPQISVLSHPSVGGFFTHCGWNSTIEALTLGVPMLCLPHMADHFINARLITEEWKVGLGFKRCKETGLVKRDEVERVMRALMLEEEGQRLRRNAKEICQRLQCESMSSKNIKALVNSLQ